MDLCHRDGSLKREVAENPAKYIHEVPFPQSQANKWEGPPALSAGLLLGSGMVSWARLDGVPGFLPNH